MDGVEIIDMWDWMDFARMNYFIFATKMYESVYCFFCGGSYPMAALFAELVVCMYRPYWVYRYTTGKYFVQYHF